MGLKANRRRGTPISRAEAIRIAMQILYDTDNRLEQEAHREWAAAWSIWEDDDEGDSEQT